MPRSSPFPAWNTPIIPFFFAAGQRIVWEENRFGKHNLLSLFKKPSFVVAAPNPIKDSLRQEKGRLKCVRNSNKERMEKKFRLFLWECGRRLGLHFLALLWTFLLGHFWLCHVGLGGWGVGLGFLLPQITKALFFSFFFLGLRSLRFQEKRSSRWWKFGNPPSRLRNSRKLDFSFPKTHFDSNLFFSSHLPLPPKKPRKKHRPF